MFFVVCYLKVQAIKPMLIFLQIFYKPRAQTIELHSEGVLNDNLTFTKSKIRSDEELLLAERGLWH